MITITLPPELEQTITEKARHKGTTPELLTLDTLLREFLPPSPPSENEGTLSDFLGDKPFLMGAEPCGADATVFAWVTSALWETTKGEVSDVIAGFANLRAYRDRGMQKWFPELVPEAGLVAGITPALSR